MDDKGPCDYTAHRDSDWRFPKEHPFGDGSLRWVCGVCHPCPFEEEHSIFDGYTGETSAWKIEHREGL